MALHCTLVRAPGSGRSDGPLELTVQAADGSPGSALDLELSHRFGTRQVSVEGKALRSLTLGQPPLVNGAILVDGAPAPDRQLSGRRGPQSDPAPLYLAVHSGPAAGRTLRLGRGSCLIGRSGADLALPDPAVSRAHARLDISERALTITDLGSCNGTFVDRRRVQTALISTGSVIRCGNSTLSVVVAGPQDWPGSGFDLAGQSVAKPLTVPCLLRRESRAGLYVGAGLPLAFGLGLALLTGMWMFLAFTVVSAASLLVPVFSGRRQRREQRAAVAGAAARDLERRRRSAPTAAELILAPGALPGSSSAPAACSVWLRLGLADQDANVRLEPADPGFRPPALGRVPLQLDPGARRVSVRGPGAATDGLMRYLLLQLSRYPLARTTRLVIYGPLGTLPLAARYLPGTSLHARSADIEAALAGSPENAGSSGILMILAGQDDAGAVGESALRHGWRVFDFTGTGAGAGEAGARAGEASIELDEVSGCLRLDGTITRFTPDLVPDDAFDRYCRARAGGPAAAAGCGPMPGACALGSLIDPTPAATARRWAAGRLAAGLSVPIGVGAGGPELLDVAADGPHVLVAGTTGSGKSELLRSLVAALALSYPPDCVSFLFFDFKGGSGLGGLRDLPHCTGMLTDLTQSELDRTMASLRAELRRREALLAASQASDLAGYRRSGAAGSEVLPRLLLVIDEFRILLDDAPDALREFMRIATIGRSLGVHLVLATQRAQGALNPEMRANITTSIGLRVQSRQESTDIIGTGAAAAIDVRVPGRAYLARGSQPVQEFQSAFLSFPSLQPGIVSVRLTTDTLDGPRPGAAVDEGVAVAPDSAPDSATQAAGAAAVLIRTLASLWEVQDCVPMPRPVAAPLPTGSAAGPPALTPAGDCERCGGDECCVGLGWLDLPAEQRVAGLTWHPGLDGHLALIDGGAMGDAAGLTGVIAERISRHPVESHLYVLDAHGTLLDRTYAGRAGAVVGLHELRRSVRVLERLCGEMSTRLSRPGGQDTPLVLAITGWGSWQSALRSGPLYWAEDLFHDLVRDGHGAGISVLISGGQELAASKFLAAVPNRAYFPRVASMESRLAWPSMPVLPPVAGRAMAVGPFAGESPAVCQFGAGTPATGDSDAAGKLLHEEPLHAKPLHAKPFRIDPLPRFLPPERLRALLNSGPQHRSSLTGRGQGDLTVYIGVGGDELSPVAVRLPRGGVLAVLGGPDSAKSAFLAAIAVVNDAVSWLGPQAASGTGDGRPARNSPSETACEEFWSQVCDEAVAGRLDRHAVLLVHDADRLPPALNQQLLELNTLGWRVIFSADSGPALVPKVPLSRAARTSGLGILVEPRSALEGDLFGQRFELEPNPPPGRAVLLADGTARPVQLALP